MTKPDDPSPGSERPEPPPASDSGASSHMPAPRTGVFLMINSLETGGSERQFIALAQALDRSAFQIDLGCLQKRGALLESVGEIQEFSLGGSLYGVKSQSTRLHLARELRRSGIAIAHAFDFYSNLTLVPAARLARVPIVIGSHRQLGDLLSPAKRWVQGRVFGICDRVVCNSRAAADRLLQQGVRAETIVVIGNAIAPAFFAAASPALERGPGVLRVGMIARMNDLSKSHRDFLAMAAKLAATSPKVEFVLVGDGPLRLGLEREAEALGLGRRITFLGDRKDIPELLASIDVSVLPSESESLSNVLIESMAAGVPVVSTRVGGTPELVGEDRGILVAPHDVEALCEGVARLLTTPALCEEFSRTGREFALANFTVESICKQYEQMYGDLLAKRVPRSRARVSVLAGKPEARTLAVVLVAPTLRYVGGQAVQADLLLRHWRNDPDVVARFIPVDPAFPRVLQWAEQVPFLRTLIRAPIYLGELWKGLAKADIAHIFSASYWSFLLAPAPAWLLARIRGKKTLINYRSGEARDHLRRSWIARSVLAQTDLLVVPSGYLVDVFGEFGLRAQVVPNIVDLSQFSFRVRDPLRPHLICTRGFHPYYNVDVVVRAFAEVQKVFPEARLDLVGGGPLEGQIRQLVQRMGLAGVDFCGVASRNEIGRFYDRADIFINASSVDNMPVSVLEAFACGTPVVTTAPESMRYIVTDGHTGLLSAPGDAEALASNVLRLLQTPGLAATLSYNAYQESQRYSWGAVRDQWLKLYRDLT